MKIRTNFVTNSSSYSSAEIKIDNPVLLEILKKYKEKGAFIVEGGYDWGNMIENSERNAKEDDITERYGYDEDEMNEALDDLDKKPVALYFYEQEMAEVFFAPESIEDVIDCILDLITHERETEMENEALFEECEKELKQRADEINKSYIEVSWETSNDGYGEDEPEEGEENSWEFHYNNRQ